MNEDLKEKEAAGKNEFGSAVILKKVELMTFRGNKKPFKVSLEKEKKSFFGLKAAPIQKLDRNFRSCATKQLCWGYLRGGIGQRQRTWTNLNRLEARNTFVLLFPADEAMQSSKE